MPLFEVGYRRYEGAFTAPGLRWIPITRTGIAIAWRSKLLRRLVYAAYLPLLYFAPVFFAIGRLTDPGAGLAEGPMRAMAESLLSPALVAQLQEDPSSVRTAVWSIVFGFFTTNVQLVLGLLVAAVVGPPLVSNDLRTRAFLIYFARPLSRWDYVLGKAGVLLFLISTVTLLPSLALYALSIVFSPSLETIVQTAPVVLSMLGATLAIALPCTALVLLFSALTVQSRFATVGWAALCAFGPIVHITLSNSQGLGEARWTFLFSLPQTMRTLQLAAFDVPGKLVRLPGSERLAELVRALSPTDSPALALGFLAAITALALLALHKRTGAPTRI
jgi:ABC-2 type transport system permease protein